MHGGVLLKNSETTAVLQSNQLIEYVFQSQQFCSHYKVLTKLVYMNHDRTFIQTALEGIKERLDDICQGRAGADVIQPMLEAFEVYIRVQMMSTVRFPFSKM